MSCVRNSKTIYLVAIFMAVARVAVAGEAPRGFEINGFVQGMHESQAKEIARKNGFDLKDTDTGAIITKGGHADSALFCKDELVRYSFVARGGFMKFLREIRSFEGQGYRRTNLDLGTQMEPDGKEAGHLTIYFFRPDDYFFVTITLLGNEDNDTDSFMVGYEALDKSAKCQ